jgi:hypothetical protein
MTKTESSKKAAKRKALENCADRNGNIDPKDVVNAARSKKNPLHDSFEWDDSVAAEAYRITQAKDLLKEFKFVVESETIDMIAPVYVSHPKDPGKYAKTVKIAESHDLSRRVLNAELARIKGSLKRAIALAAMFGQSIYFERALDHIVEGERNLGLGGDDDRAPPPAH